MTIHLHDPVDKIWSPIIVVVAGVLFALPAVALTLFGVLSLAG